MGEEGDDLDNCTLELVDRIAVDRKSGWSDWWMEFSDLRQPGNRGIHQLKTLHEEWGLRKSNLLSGDIKARTGVQA
jgi:hypothetical protein